MYRVVHQGFTGTRKLYPVQDGLYKYVKDINKDYYSSIFMYNEEHKKQLEQTGSLAGIEGVETDLLAFDLDSHTDLEKTRHEALILSHRLIDKGIDEQAINIAFSGSKGFSITVKLNKKLTLSEFKSINLALAEGLETNDTKILDSNRIFRITGTKHHTSGLFKFPLTLKELEDCPVSIIKDGASDIAHATFDYKVQKAVDLPDTIYNLKDFKKEVVAPKVVLDVSDLDFSKKPKGFTNCKFSLLEGFYTSGQRNNALLTLVATCRANGYSKEIAYNMAKASIRLQATRYGQSAFDKKELWLNIVSQIYRPTWDGGQFSCKKEGWLRDYCQALGKNKCSHTEQEFKFSSEMYNHYEDYATKIEENTIKTGIHALDENVRLTVGMPVALLGAPSSGKCLGLGTPIIMFDGSTKKVEDIKVGDLLMGDDSTPRTVLTLARGREPLYKVEQSYGIDYVVNESHILSLKCGASFADYKRSKKFTYGKLRDIEVKDYFRESKSFRRYYKGYKVGVEFAKQSIKLNAYILGYWLGNGTSSKPSFTVHKDHIEVQNKLKEFATKIGLNYKEINNSDKSYTINLVRNNHKKNPLTQLLQDIGVFNNKHIPNSYLTNSREIRMELLAGLIDSDAFFDSKKNTYEFCSSDKDFCSQVTWLCSSLGFKSVMSYKKAKYNSFTKGKLYQGYADAWRLYIAGENVHNIPVLLPYKKAQQKDHVTDPMLSSLTLIPLGVGDYYGFEIDGNKRFLLGDFTVTHNTSLALNVLNNTSLNNLSSVFFSMDMYGPLVYQKQIQKKFGLADKQIFEIFKHDRKRANEIKESINNEYKNVKFALKSGYSVSEMRETIDDYEQKHGDKVKLVLIDYLECIAGPYSDATANTHKIAGELRDFATDTNRCIITLVQPPKSAGDASYPLTSMRQIKGSSMLEQSFRVILGIYREGFGPKSPEKDKFITINSLKNTMGPLFSVDNEWEGRTGSILPISDEGEWELTSLRESKMKDKAEESSWG